jgi:ribose transport system permease protein
VRKALGLFGLLAVLIVGATLWEASTGSGNRVFLTHANARNVLMLIGLFGIFSLGQSLVIITGGIDLSVGSGAALVGLACAMMLDKGEGWSAAVVLPLCLLIGLGMGLFHGVLVTKGRMQPFVVTLCALFLYRGIARWVAEDRSQGFGTGYPSLKWLGAGFVPEKTSLIPVPFVIFIVLAIVLAAYLHFSASGRHLFALGANEEGARFSGIQTDRLKILAYAFCGLFTAVGGLLFAFKVQSLSPANFGGFYELYAIAGAVLGGCSLRGGAGNVLGIVLGASLIVVLRNLVNILEIPSELEYVVIGGAILIGVFVDELLSRRRTPARVHG